MEHIQQKTKHTDIKSAHQGDFENQVSQPTDASILQLQRTIGNRATIQRLKNPLSLAAATEAVTNAETVTEQEAGSDIQGPIQRVALMTGDAMIAIAPRTTTLFGKPKVTAYNTLLDTLKSYWAYANGPKRRVEDVLKNTDAVLKAADVWWAKHGTSTKKSEAAKKEAVNQTRAAATALKASLTTARDQLAAQTVGINEMYSTPAIWAKITEWSTTWYIEDNTSFYNSFRTFTTIEEGKAIIAKYLTRGSEQELNVSGPLFDRAGALRAKTEGLEVSEFRALFEDCVRAASQVWNDLIMKINSDVVQPGHDSFAFEYIRTVIPDMMG